jgi:hypothetical protein
MTGRIKHYSTADVFDGGLQQRRISSSLCCGIKEVKKEEEIDADVALMSDFLLMIRTDC